MPIYDVGGEDVTMGGTRRKFTLEFKTETAHRVIDRRRSVTEVAKDSSVTEISLIAGSAMNKAHGRSVKYW